MHVLHSLSLSALLLAASVPAFAVTAGDAAQAIPAPAAPAIQVAPAVPAASATAPTAPLGSAAVPAAPAAARPLPALPAGTAALGSLVNPQTLALLDSLQALQVSPQQAVGGVGALLGLAQNRLAGDQYAQLAGTVPGLELLGGDSGNAGNGVLGRLGALSGLLGGSASQAPQGGAPAGSVDSLEDVNQAFSALGMGAGLVGQFAPILLQFLGSQGVAGTLLQSLGGIWGVPGALAPATPAGTPVAVGG